VHGALSICDRVFDFVLADAQSWYDGPALLVGFIDFLSLLFER
jgi:hypothetical protein